MKSRALLIGVNHVDKDKYHGWEGPLTCPENDVGAIKALLESKGIVDTTVLTTADATSHAVTATIIDAAEALEPGDFFFMYYSGHGNSIEDNENQDEFEDNRDETMCLYDAQLLDDELFTLWPRFKAGVNVFVMADCCHSGSITRDATDPDYVKRAMDPKSANRIMRRDGAKIAEHRRNLPQDGGPIQASIRLLSGCQDDQQSFEKKSIGHGLLTASFIEVMTENPSNYAEMHTAILKKMPDFQTPNLFNLGPELPDDKPPFST